MARATFVKSARKDYPDYGIKKGESYYWWKFRYGGKHVSKTAPRPSQLTNSSFLSAVYGALEIIEDLDAKDGAEAVADAIRDAAQQIRDAADETQSNLDNMPEGLQQGDTGQMMEQRISDAEQLADDLEGIVDDVAELADGENREDGEKDEEFEARQAEELQAKIDDAQAMSYDGE